MILYGSWTRLPLHVRHDIARQFGIPKSFSTHVADNQVVQDGYKVEDIEARLSVSAMQEYTGSNEKDAMILWGIVVSKVQGLEPEPSVVAVETPVSVAPIKKKAAPKKRGRKPKLM